MQQIQQPRLVRRAGLFLLAFALTLPGCASIANFTAMRGIPVASSENPVRDFTGIWQQGEGRDEHGRPCRGFCGQLMFMTVGANKPAIVHGAVTIYVFDNKGTLEEQAKPFDKFEFTAEQWETFQRKTNLGMTYQLFIPYRRPGGREAECQLHVKFTPVNGSPMFAHPASISMRGASGAAAMADAIDHKLTSSSLLFQNPALSRPPVTGDPAINEMVRKFQADSKVPAATSPSIPAARPANPQAEVDRLQAVLNASTSRSVEQADYARSSARPAGRVAQAAHEEPVE